MAGTLFVVGTPIGNMGDMTRRAVETLEAVGLVAAEDTRRTGRLLQGLGLHKRLVSLFDANERARTPEIVRELHAGTSVALVSDGGMPLVSDPGYRLVRACLDEGIAVRVVPGPSAVTAALAVSGLPSDRFAFEGFAPKKQGERMARLEALAHDPRTLVFFESPVRAHTLLRDLMVAFGDRQVAVCRELTKLHEEVVRGSISDVLSELSELKGEVVVVVEGRRETPAPDMQACVDEMAELVAEGMRKRDAAHAVAERHGVSANELYRVSIRRRS
jgi:16S rRNA (cytidine1402-2'-O)-methyltransferase